MHPTGRTVGLPMQKRQTHPNVLVEPFWHPPTSRGLVWICKKQLRDEGLLQGSCPGCGVVTFSIVESCLFSDLVLSSSTRLLCKDYRCNPLIFFENMLAQISGKQKLNPACFSPNKLAKLCAIKQPLEHHWWLLAVSETLTWRERSGCHIRNILKDLSSCSCIPQTGY